MIVDMRTYTLHPGNLGAYNRLYGTEGYPVQTRHLGPPLGYYVVDIGVQNRIVHLWGYEDIKERQDKRNAMQADPAWQSYVTRAMQYFQSQENRILRPTPFWPRKREGGLVPGIVDLRIYTFHAGKLPAFFRLYENEGMATQLKHLGNCLGFYASDIGGQNQIVHLWAYADIADRQRRRAAMQADPQWQAYLAKSAPLLVHMENSILRPAPFWTPPRL